MSEEKLQSSKVRRGLSIGLHLVIPFWAMRQTYRLAKNEVSGSKEHLEVIRQLSAEARKHCATAVKRQIVSSCHSARR